MARILYITHTGMAEPLGQSQVMGYLRPLAKNRQIHLVSFEKQTDFSDPQKMEQIQELCDQAGISWTARQFRTSPRYFSSIGNVFDLYQTALKEARAQQSDVIHARSYLPSLVASWVGRKVGIPFVFDMRALWPEELIGAGRVKRNGLVHRALIGVERKCLQRAGRVVSLTHAAVDYLKKTYPLQTQDKGFSVIPTCVDLDRFTVEKPRAKEGLTIGCSGTVISGFFRIDLLARVFAAAAERWPSARFEIVSKDDPEEVRKALKKHGFPIERLTQRSARPDEMPGVHAGHDVSAMFFTTNVGKLGSCPTRMGEALACGTPVLINPGIGDVGKMADEHAPILALGGEAEKDIEMALDGLEKLWATDGFSSVCRESAEAIFSLQSGVEEYDRIYRDLAKK